jgi:Rad3-related DNA helicase
MTINQFGEGLGNFDLMVMDEGHNVPDELSGFLSVELEAYDIEQVMRAKMMPDGANIDDWRKWAAFHGGQLRAAYDLLQEKIKAARASKSKVDHSMMRQAGQMKRTLQKVLAVAGMKDEWVFERQGKTMKFDPVWPAKYAEAVLFRKTPKVVIFSATIRQKTAQVLGITDYDFNEYPSTFPKDRRPIYHIPTCQMNHRTDEMSMRKWLRTIDLIIGQRPGTKGIIHTVSFARRNQVMQHSEHRSIMIANDSSNTRYVVERFKTMDPPAILVSPSLTTGWDFPYDACDWQIIGKIPFPDNRPQVIQARMKSDKDYTNYMAAQILIQMTGRGMRAEDDWCENFIIDDNIEWFVWKFKQFFPKWWIESFQKTNIVPKLPEFMREGRR